MLHTLTNLLRTQCLGLQARKSAQVPAVQPMLAIIAIILLFTRMILISNVIPTPPPRFHFDVVKIIPSLAFSVTVRTN